MDPVEPDLEVVDAGALTLSRLQRHQIIIGVLAQVPQLVQLSVVAGGDDPAIAQGLRRVGDDRPIEQSVDFGMPSRPVGKILKQGCVCPVEKVLHRRQTGQRIGQGDQIAWPRRFQRDSRQNPLHVAGAAQ